MAIDEATRQTILGESEGLLKLLAELRSALDSHFARTPQDSMKPEASPSHDDVLDEILVNLNEASAKTREITSFLLDSVLPKIN